MKSGYSIETHESGRFIVWRLTSDNKYRLGSYDTYEGADRRIDEAIERMNDSGEKDNGTSKMVS